MTTLKEFTCFTVGCGHAVTLFDDWGSFCEGCKTLYWLNNDGEIEVRMPKCVEPEPKGTC